MNTFHHKPHLSFVHWVWKSHIKKEATVLDATLGNGHDSIFILKEILNAGTGKLYAIDIQKEAIDSTLKNMQKASLNEFLIGQFHPIKACHSTIDQIEIPENFDLIVYNLGYLPGADKGITTLSETTLISIKKALLKLSAFGMITITLYPGHDEGEVESQHIEAFIQTLDEKSYQVLKLTWQNKKIAPYVIVIQKRD